MTETWNTRPGRAGDNGERKQRRKDEAGKNPKGNFQEPKSYHTLLCARVISLPWLSCRCVKVEAGARSRSAPPRVRPTGKDTNWHHTSREGNRKQKPKYKQILTLPPCVKMMTPHRNQPGLGAWHNTPSRKPFGPPSALICVVTAALLQSGNACPLTNRRVLSQAKGWRRGNDWQPC